VNAGGAIVPDRILSGAGSTAGAARGDRYGPDVDLRAWIDVRPCDDVRGLTAVARHPAVFDASSDDHCTDPEQVDMTPVVASAHMLALGIFAGGSLAGFFLLVRHSNVLTEIHTAILPYIRGRPAEFAAQRLLSYVFDRTPCQKLMTLVPASNRAAALFALRAGFKAQGTLTDSFLKGGLLHDQRIFGLSRADHLARRAATS